MRLGPRLFMGIGPARLRRRDALAPRCSRRRSTTGPSCFPPLLLFAVGLSLIVAPLTATVLADAGPSDAGIASGVNNAVARVAGLLGIAVVGATRSPASGNRST